MRTATEQRQYRRAEIDASLSIRLLSQLSQNEPASPIPCRVKNASLAGVYCYVGDGYSLKPGDQVVCSLAIPTEQTRLFPFRRVLGKGRIVRVEPIPTGRRAGESPSGQQLFGAAIAFAPDITALGSLE